MKKLIKLGDVERETRGLFRRCKGSATQDVNGHNCVDTTCATYQQNSICVWSNGSGGKACTC